MEDDCIDEISNKIVVGDKWGYYYKFQKLLQENQNIPNSSLIIAKDNFYNNNVLKKYKIITSDDANKELYKNNDNIYEVIQSFKDIYYKLFIDIDFYKPLDDNDKMTDFITELIDKIVDFIKIEIDKTKILISSSNGIKNDKNKISYHIIFPYIFKWRNVKNINEILTENIYNYYNSLYQSNIIDTNNIKCNQLLRCLYQAKYNEERYNIPFNLQPFGYSEDVKDHLIGLYNEDDVENYYIIDNLFTQNINNHHQEIKQFKKNDRIENYTCILGDDIYKYDKVSCLLFNIPNTLLNINRYTWFNIISLISGYILSITDDILSENNSIYLDIYPKKIKEYYIDQCLKWTLQAYTNEIENNLKKSNVIQLKQKAKDLNIKGYSKLNKEQLLNALQFKQEFSIDEINKHRNNIINIFNYYNKENNKNYFKKAFNKLYQISYNYNKKNIKKWTVMNEIPKSIYLDFQPYFKIEPFPSHEDLTVFNYIGKYKFIYLQAIMGIGKTQIIQNIVRFFPDASILILIPRSTLKDAFKSRYNSEFFTTKEHFEVYKENSKINKNIFNDDIILKRFICTIESCWRIPSYYKYDFVILDELDCLSDSLSGDTVKTNGLLTIRINRFINLIDTSSTTIMAEAIPSLSSTSIMKSVRNDENVLSFITDKIRFKQKYILKSNYKSMKYKEVVEHCLNDLRRDLRRGMRITALITSKKVLKGLVSELQYDFKVLGIHAYNKNEMKPYYIDGGKKIIEDGYQLLLYTTTLAVGFSQEHETYWDLKYIFYKQFGNLTNSCISANLVIQANYRCRYIGSNINDGNDIFDDVDDVEDVENDDDDNNFIDESDDDENYNEVITNCINDDADIKDDIKDDVAEIKQENIQITKVYIADVPNTLHNLTTNSNYTKKLIEDQEKIDRKTELELMNLYNINKTDLDVINLLSNYENNVDGYNCIKGTKTIDEIDYIVYYTFNYIDDADIIDTDIKFKIEAYKYYRYSSLGLIFNEKSKNLMTSLKKANFIKNNISKKYIEETLKAIVEKMGGEWDDSNVKRSYKEKQDIKPISSIVDTKDEQQKQEEHQQNGFIIITELDDIIVIDDIKYNVNKVIRYIEKYTNCDNIIYKNIKDNDDKDESYFKLINTENSFGDPEYTDENKKFIEIKYILLTYFNPNIYINDHVSAGNDEYFKIIKNLIIYYHSNKNHFRGQDYKFNVNCNIIKFLFNSKIIDEETFKTDLRDIIIDSIILDDNDKKIDELYKDYLTKNTLKGPRNCNKAISKLNYLIYEIFGLGIDISKSEKINKKINGKVKTYFHYKFIDIYSIEDNVNIEGFKTILNNFSYKKRININEWVAYNEFIKIRYKKYLKTKDVIIEKAKTKDVIKKSSDDDTNVIEKKEQKDRFDIKKSSLISKKKDEIIKEINENNEILKDKTSISKKNKKYLNEWYIYLTHPLNFNIDKIVQYLLDQEDFIKEASGLASNIRLNI